VTDQLPDHEPELGPDNARVFLSYSRKDRERAQSIADVLRDKHFGVFKDTDDILPTEEWKGRLEQLIAEADTIVFLMSPHSVASEVCAWEVEYATELNKRIAPIVIDDVEAGDIPPLLARLNFIFATERDRFQDAVDSLVSALNSDIDWIREHTRLAGLARRWRDNNRSGRLLLRGQDIADAEQWRDARPKEAPAILSLHADFIAASRAAAVRRQRLVAGFSLAGLAIALGLAAFALVQREAAVENEQLARASEIVARENEQEAIAERTAAEAAQQQAVKERNAAQVSQARMLAGNAERALAAGQPLDAALLALEGLPDHRSSEPLRRNRPLVDELLLALSEATPEVRELSILVSGNDAFRFRLSKDERLLAAHNGSTGRLVIVDMKTGKIVRDLNEAAFRSTSRPPFISSSGELIAMPGADGSVWIIPTEPEGLIQKVNMDGTEVVNAILTNEGRTIVATTAKQQLYRINVDKSQPKIIIQATSVIASPTGQHYAAIKDGFVGVFDAATDKLVDKPSKKLKGPLKSADSLVYSPNGKWLAALSEHLVWILNGETGAFIVKTGQRNQSVMSAGFDPSGNLLFVTGADGRTLVFDLAKENLLASHEGQKNWVMDAAISPDTRTTVSGTSGAEIEIRNTSDGTVIETLLGHEDMVLQVRLIDKGARLITSSEDGTIRLWNLPERTRSGKSQIEGFAGTAIYSADGQMVALSETGVFNVLTGKRLAPGGASDGMWHFVRFTSDGRLLTKINNGVSGDSPDACLLTVETLPAGRCMFNRADGNIWSVDVDPGGRTIAMHAVFEQKSAIVSFDAETGTEVGRLPFRPLDSKGGSFSEPAISADGEHLLVVRNTHEVAVYDRELKSEIRRITSSLAYPTIQFFPDRARVLFVSDNDKAAEIVDVSTGNRVVHFELDRPARSPVEFSPTGKFVLTSTHRGTLQIRNSATGKVIAEPEVPGKETMMNPIFSADEAFVLISRDATTIAVDLTTGGMIAEYKLDFGEAYPFVFAKGFAPDQSAVVAWSWDGPKSWPFVRDAHAFVAKTQDSVARCLTPEQRRTNFLSPEPPRWCITGAGLENEADPARWQPVWPYGAGTWRQWQVSRDKGEEAALPSGN
jgi:WD40 repeat protein